MRLAVEPVAQFLNGGHIALIAFGKQHLGQLLKRERVFLLAALDGALDCLGPFGIAGLTPGPSRYACHFENR